MDSDSNPELSDCITCSTIKNITNINDQINTVDETKNSTTNINVDGLLLSPSCPLLGPHPKPTKCIEEKEDTCLNLNENKLKKKETRDTTYDDDFEDDADLDYLNQHFNTSVSLCSSSSKRNVTFKNSELRDIERVNTILMKKIMSHSQRTNQYNVPPKQYGFKKLSSLAINRKRQEEKINRENLILLKKIQSVKSTFKK
ncbi:unnamed protein product [Psylliodes chrysocephalus]|uniref:Uncharacterized protein n=1 Tax=Psylliodes chrysocephalus TaxID=3402493 RepID=A0A9P0G3S2_9CUCU|nr:unnamed protein product [Psylliodes chrysocephala]